MMFADSTLPAEPVSTRTSRIDSDAPRCVTMTVANGSSLRRSSCIAPSEADPRTFIDFQLAVGRVGEVELAVGMFRVQLAIPAERSCTIRTDFDDRQLIDDALVSLGAGIEGLDDQPLLGVLPSRVFPAHRTNLSPLQAHCQLSRLRIECASSESQVQCGLRTPSTGNRSALRRR